MSDTREKEIVAPDYQMELFHDTNRSQFVEGPPPASTSRRLPPNISVHTQDKAAGKKLVINEGETVNDDPQNVFPFLDGLVYRLLLIVVCSTAVLHDVEAFYLYLYLGSITFLAYVYMSFLKKEAINRTKEIHGEMFGFCSVIYAVLSFGQYFELKRTPECNNILVAITPLVRATFVVGQMIYVFSLHDRFLEVYKHALVARFGIMHMIATNLSEWLYVVVEETKYDIQQHFRNLEERNLIQILNNPNETESGSFSESLELRNSIAFLPDKSSECWRSQIMKNLLRNSSPFLFPCTVEYSLLCTVILAVMWRMACNNLDSPRTRKQSGVNVIYARSTSQFSVDCASAYKGLIAGLLVTVISTISLILFFELIRQPKYAELAVFQVNVWEAVVLGTSIAVVILCYMKMKTIGKRRQHRDLELEHILLFVTQFGVFLYTLFHIIGAYFMMDAANNRWDVLRIVTPVSALVQSLCQTLLVLDAWRRGCSTPEQVGRKPGRQMVTFLLVANMVMWIVNRLVNNRAESYPEQMEFYGVWAWTIITHMCMPLVVCYRFQSSVCLYEVWKHVYKQTRQ
uniref:Otopetrin n=1 Tax=Timema douglasi TaxID=61478 RepID=A0A7R8VKF2_TIMDO|nr:unnamed protein product [Timema douglasi]